MRTDAHVGNLIRPESRRKKNTTKLAVKCRIKRSTMFHKTYLSDEHRQGFDNYKVSNISGNHFNGKHFYVYSMETPFYVLPLNALE